MKNKKKLINQIIYRSTHRGTKEIDILLGSFVKRYINKFNDKELSDLVKILNYDDEKLRCHKIRVFNQFLQSQLNQY